MPRLNAVSIQVSVKAIANLLHLPDNVKISCVRQTWEDAQMGRFEMIVESPDLPMTYDGQPLPWGNIVFHTEFCTADEISHIVRGEVKAA